MRTCKMIGLQCISWSGIEMEVGDRNEDARRNCAGFSSVCHPAGRRAGGVSLPGRPGAVHECGVVRSLLAAGES